MKSTFLATLCVALGFVSLAVRGDLLIADFEQESYGDWTVEGEAFGDGPAKGKLGGQMAVTGFKGQGLVNSYLRGDGAVGTLTSPSFEIERPYVGFLIGGGGYEGKTCMNLVVDGPVVRSATGWNTAPGGSEELRAGGWDVRDVAGKQATLQIVDDRTGGWGHINVDHIVQTATKPEIMEMVKTSLMEKEFTVAHRYLVIPIQNKPRKARGGGRLQLFIDGEVVRDYGLHLAPSEELTDWYAYFTIESYRGKSARVVATKATEEGFALALPWGNMTWGHATSSDLLHWEQQPNCPGTMNARSCSSFRLTKTRRKRVGSSLPLMRSMRWGVSMGRRLLPTTKASTRSIGGRTMHRRPSTTRPTDVRSRWAGFACTRLRSDPSTSHRSGSWLRPHTDASAACCFGFDTFADVLSDPSLEDHSGPSPVVPSTIGRSALSGETTLLAPCRLPWCARDSSPIAVNPAA